MVPPPRHGRVTLTTATTTRMHRVARLARAAGARRRIRGSRDLTGLRVVERVLRETSAFLRGVGRDEGAKDEAFALMLGRLGVPLPLGANQAGPTAEEIDALERLAEELFFCPAMRLSMAVAEHLADWIDEDWLVAVRAEERRLMHAAMRDPAWTGDDRNADADGHGEEAAGIGDEEQE